MCMYVCMYVCGEAEKEGSKIETFERASAQFFNRRSMEVVATSGLERPRE